MEPTNKATPSYSSQESDRKRDAEVTMMSIHCAEQQGNFPGAIEIASRIRDTTAKIKTIAEILIQAHLAHNGDQANRILHSFFNDNILASEEMMAQVVLEKQKAQLFDKADRYLQVITIQEIRDRILPKPFKKIEARAFQMPTSVQDDVLNKAGLGKFASAFEEVLTIPIVLKRQDSQLLDKAWRDSHVISMQEIRDRILPKPFKKIEARAFQMPTCVQDTVLHKAQSGKFASAFEEALAIPSEVLRNIRFVQLFILLCEETDETNIGIRSIIEEMHLIEDTKLMAMVALSAILDREGELALACMDLITDDEVKTKLSYILQQAIYSEEAEEQMKPEKTTIAPRSREKAKIVQSAQLIKQKYPILVDLLRSQEYDSARLVTDDISESPETIAAVKYIIDALELTGLDLDTYAKKMQ